MAMDQLWIGCGNSDQQDAGLSTVIAQPKISIATRNPLIGVRVST
jgi:hypothetical protein